MITVGSKWVRNDYTRREAVVDRVEPNKVYVKYPASPNREPERFGLSVFAAMFKEVV